MVQQDIGERLGILEQPFHRASRQLGERRIGRGEDRERSLALQRLYQSGRLDRRNQRLELARTDRCGDNVFRRSRSDLPGRTIGNGKLVDVLVVVAVSAHHPQAEGVFAVGQAQRIERVAELTGCLAQRQENRRIRIAARQQVQLPLQEGRIAGITLHYDCAAHRRPVLRAGDAVADRRAGRQGQAQY